MIEHRPILDRPFFYTDRCQLSQPGARKPVHPLDYILEHSPAWHPIYTGKVAVLFERVPAAAALATIGRKSGPIK
jgi:hypothetical protein